MVRSLMAVLLCLMTALHPTQAGFAIFQVGRSGGATSNAASPLGINLAGVSYFSPQQPFANILSNQTQFGLDGTGAGAQQSLLCLDANFWITTFANVLTAPGADPATQCTAASNITGYHFFLQDFSPYPGGTYDIYYTGSCTWSGTTHVGTGHDTMTLTPTGGGTFLTLTAMGTGNSTTTGYCRNVSITRQALTAAYLGAGLGGTGPGCNQFTGGPYGSACFDPNFLSFLSPFRAVRFMDWMCTNAAGRSYNAVDFNGATWAGRPVPGMPYYASDLDLSPVEYIPCGVPVEMMVALANAGNFDPWFNMPTLANNTYVTNFANYVLANLTSTLRPYVEYSNETWNSGFLQNSQLVQYICVNNPTIFMQYSATVTAGKDSLGCAASGSGSSSLASNRAVMGYQSMTFCGLWKTAFGGSSGRVNCTLASQAADTNEAIYALNCHGAIQASGNITITGTTSFTVSGLTGTISVGSYASFTGATNDGTQSTAQVTAWNGSSGTISPAQSNVSGLAATFSPQFGFSGSACQGQMQYVAIAPYFGCDVNNSGSPSVPAAWLSDGTGGVQSMVQATNNGGATLPNGQTWGGTNCANNFGAGSGTALLAKSSQWETDYITGVAGPYSMSVVQYEGGQSWSSENYAAWQAPQQSLMATTTPGVTVGTACATGSPSMQSIYLCRYLTAKNNGMQLMMHFNDVQQAGGFYWGVIQNLCDGGTGTYSCDNPTWNVGNDTRYQALVTFIQNEPCWWASCSH